MNLEEVTKRFLEWEKDNKWYEVCLNGYPVYSFIRVEIYESIIFASDLNKIFRKTGNVSLKKINYRKILHNSLRYVLKESSLKKQKLVITNTENKIKVDDYYVDKFFDKIIRKTSSEVSVLEFPDSKEYHYNNILNKGKTVEGDIFYVLEKLFPGRIDKEKLIDTSKRIFEAYSKLFKEIYGLTPAKGSEEEIYKRIKRNISRIHIYEWFIKKYKPREVFLKSSYSPLMQIFIFLCKKYKVKTIEVQHGHIYPLHIGYLMPMDIEGCNELFPDRILVWSNYYKEILIKNNWKANKIRVIGDFTYNKELVIKNSSDISALVKLSKQYSKVITLVSQHTLDKEFVEYLNNVNDLPESVLVFIKLHPKYIGAQEKSFKTIIEKFNNVLLVTQGNIKDYLQISDLVVGVYSTGIIEALEMNKVVHLIDTDMSQFFNDLVEMEIIQKSKSIASSYNKIINQDNNINIEFRSKFLGYHI
ncbi:hypothetical protein AB832_05530 [Flavobacteriaceae bacterium (ex Bugula neritina AB1)]|nr:hypothetical protein AB832_05530 [Flavobacteriaceae bacterium (ex Bugula neritina AB1)]